MSTTPNLGLSLPVRGSQNWGTPLNGNFSDIDSVVGGGTAGNVLTSNGPGTAPTWQPSSGGGGSSTQIDNETPGGAINGTTGSDGNNTFTVANAPNPQSSLHLTVNGQEFYVGVAFSLSGSVITIFAPNIPVTNDLMRVSYRINPIGPSTQVDNETPSGVINGMTGSDGNPTFTLANPPNPSTSLHLTLNGQEIYVGVGFTLLGNTITYLATNIPVTGDLHRASYRF